LLVLASQFGQQAGGRRGRPYIYLRIDERRYDNNKGNGAKGLRSHPSEED
jgi:hypothetical protein